MYHTSNTDIPISSGAGRFQKEVQRLIREKELEKQRTLQEQNRMFSAISLMDADVLKKTKEREPLEMTYESLDRQAKREVRFSPCRMFL